MFDLSSFTAVIPAAGIGSRLLPATKAIPKELLPIVDTPAIQYLVEEIVSSGINRIVFITAQGKEAIIDHFDSAPDLETLLTNRRKLELLERVIAPTNMAQYIAVRQNRPLGLGHAVLMARKVVGENPFAVLLPDDLIDAPRPALRQLLDVYEQYSPHGVLALMPVSDADVSKYGIVAGHSLPDGTIHIRDIVEKPPLESAPSRLAVIGRYILHPETFAMLEKIPRGSGGEVQLTDALAALVHEGRTLLGCLFHGRRHDTGDVLGYLEANIHYALKRPELAEKLRQNLPDWLSRIPR